MAVTAASPRSCYKNQAASTLTPPRRKNRRRVSEQTPAGRGKPDYQSDGPGKSPAGGKNLNMGQVRILKRGENLNETATELPIIGASAGAAAPQPRRDSNRPDKESNSYGVVESLFAGTSFFTVSPPPSSVPLPMFCLKKKKVELSATVKLF